MFFHAIARGVDLILMKKQRKKKMSNNIRADLIFLRGQLSALEWGLQGNESHGFMNLMTNINEQLYSIIKRLYPDYDDE